MAETAGAARVMTGLFFDDRELERIYKAHRGLVHNAVAWKLSGIPKEEIEEIASSVWLKLLADDCARLKSFGRKNGAQLATWLAKVAKNAAVDYLRKKRIVSVPLEGSWNAEEGEYGLGDFLKDRSPDPLERLVSRETRKELLLAVKRLPKIYRQIVYARFYRGWGVAETAATFGIAQDTVYVRLARAFAKLRKDLARRGVVPPEEDTPMPNGPTHRHFSDARIMRLLDSADTGRDPSGPLCFSCWSRLFQAALLWELLSSMRRPPGRWPS